MAPELPSCGADPLSCFDINNQLATFLARHHITIEKLAFMKSSIFKPKKTHYSRQQASTGPLHCLIVLR